MSEVQTWGYKLLYSLCFTFSMIFYFAIILWLKLNKCICVFLNLLMEKNYTVWKEIIFFAVWFLNLLKIDKLIPEFSNTREILSRELYCGQCKYYTFYLLFRTWNSRVQHCWIKKHNSIKKNLSLNNKNIILKTELISIFITPRIKINIRVLCVMFSVLF